MAEMGLELRPSARMAYALSPSPLYLSGEEGSGCSRGLRGGREGKCNKPGEVCPLLYNPPVLFLKKRVPDFKLHKVIFNA